MIKRLKRYLIKTKLKIMSQFNINRFWLTLKKDIAENIKVVINTILISLLIVLVFIIIEVVNSPDSIIDLNKSFRIYYFVILVILGTVFAGFSFPAFRKTEKAISYLTLPSSTIEKYLSYLLLSSFGFFILFTLMFLLFDYVVIFVFNLYKPEYIQSYLTFDSKIFPTIISVYFNLNALFLLGAVVFKKSPHFKTSLFVLSVFLIIFLTLSISIYFVNNYSLDLGKSNMFHKSDHLLIPFDNTFPSVVIKHLLQYGLVLFFWFVAYLKLKEKEI